MFAGNKNTEFLYAADLGSLIHVSRKFLEKNQIISQWQIDLSEGKFGETLINLFEDDDLLLRSLSHPVLPDIQRTELKDGKIIIEYLCPPGQQFTSMFEESSPPFSICIGWLHQLSTCISYLHGIVPYPVIHGMLAPQGLWISKWNEMHLLDMGLLRVFSRAKALSKSSLSEAKDNFVLRLMDDVRGFGNVLRYVVEKLKIDKDHAGRIDTELNGNIDALFVLANECTNDSEAVANCKSLMQRLDALVPGNQQIKSELVHNEVVSSEEVELVKDRIQVDESSKKQLCEVVKMNQPAPLVLFNQRQNLDEIYSSPSFDTLLSPDTFSGFNALPHQLSVAHEALNRLSGRALLADQVGMGKTIEAGIIIKEFYLRGLANHVLIICPRQLATQWQLELYEKFDELFLVMGRDIDSSLAWKCPRLITPYRFIEQRFHAEFLQRETYDLVIVDEAHYLNDRRNRHALRTIEGLRKKYFLLLSATPMHNDLLELYNIIRLLKPGHFPDQESFENKYVDPEDRHGIRNAEDLRNILRQVMIRTLRSKVDFGTLFPRRNPYMVKVFPKDEGFAKYEKFRRRYRKEMEALGNDKFILDLCGLVERLCSSKEAFEAEINRHGRRLARRVSDEFVNFLRQVSEDFPHSLVNPKIEKALLHALAEVEKGKKVLVFSQFNETAKYLYEKARNTKLGINCWLYDEDAAQENNNAAIRSLRQAKKGVLFCPGEASEGLNLQFASVMINYDLPWDPMKIEQRIGRIQRIGGPEEVLIINLFLTGTVEEQIIEILGKKLNMFKAAVGEIEEILGRLGDEEDIRTMIGNVYLERIITTDEGNEISAEMMMKHKLDKILAQRSEGTKSERELNRLWGEDEDEEDEDDF